MYDVLRVELNIDKNIVTRKHVHVLHIYTSANIERTSLVAAVPCVRVSKESSFSRRRYRFITRGLFLPAESANSYFSSRIIGPNDFSAYKGLQI